MSVTLYTTSWCPHCQALVNFLDENDIEYINYDVDENDDKWKEGMEKADGKDIVPIVDIDGKIFYGRFSDIKDKVANELNID